MNAALLIDFGSTYTKLRAVDLDRRRLLGSGQGPSTVTTDILLGMRESLADLEGRLGSLPRFKYRLASSSAAGGLRMVTVGLVRELTAEAARRAALGAGAKLVGTFAYRLTHGDVDSIVTLAPDIVLVAGGTDGGNRDAILHNARALGASPLACPIVLAGNRDAADEARDVLAGKDVRVTANVMPELNVLDVEPARAAIRQVFIDRIVHAKGIDRARAEFDAVLMPTPAAVLEGARLVADGCAGVAGLGDLLVVDPGGATTDVHSIAGGEPSVPGTIVQGLPQPRVARTVEGDLGMRHNAANVVDVAGMEAIAADAGLDAARVRALVAEIGADVERLPRDEAEARLERALVRAAVRHGVIRHCGTVDTVYTVSGPVAVQHGKDLSAVGTVIGTGGALVHSPDPRAVLETALAEPALPRSLRPKSPKLLLDRHYLLYACGLLAEAEREAALELALASLEPIDSRVERPLVA